MLRKIELSAAVGIRSLLTIESWKLGALVFYLSIITVPNLLRLALSFSGMLVKLVMLYGVYVSLKIDM